MPTELDISEWHPAVTDQWAARFFAYIAEKPGADEVWGRLLLGGNPLLLMKAAAAVVTGAPSDLEGSRGNLRLFSAKLKSGIRKVLAAAELIEELNSDASVHSAELSDFVDLPEKLRDYSRSLEGYSKIASKHSSERLPKTSDYGLYLLHTYILKSTGKPQWRGTATLLEAAQAAYGREVEIDDESIRKKIKGLMARDTRTCSYVERKIEEYIANGNGNWFTRTELEKMTRDMALKYIQERHPEAKLSE